MAPPISIHKVWLRSAHGTSVQWRIAIRNKTDEIGNGVLSSATDRSAEASQPLSLTNREQSEETLIKLGSRCVSVAQPSAVAKQQLGLHPEDP